MYRGRDTRRDHYHLGRLLRKVIPTAHQRIGASGVDETRCTRYTAIYQADLGSAAGRIIDPPRARLVNCLALFWVSASAPSALQHSDVCGQIFADSAPVGVENENHGIFGVTK